MINIKQLKYFITCADAGSFSEAASVLYTTQSSVSKVIRALEEEMQASLFVRNPHGISLTQNGKQAYAYASRVLENVEAMAELSAVGDTQWLNIAFNPSSWIADCFVRFYQIHEKENLHCQVHTGKMREVLERIHEYKDELGFLYVTTRQQTDLQYLLVRKQLEFIPLKELATKNEHATACPAVILSTIFPRRSGGIREAPMAPSTAIRIPMDNHFCFFTVSIRIFRTFPLCFMTVLYFLCGK